MTSSHKQVSKSLPVQIFYFTNIILNDGKTSLLIKYIYLYVYTYVINVISPTFITPVANRYLTVANRYITGTS